MKTIAFIFGAILIMTSCKTEEVVVQATQENNTPLTELSDPKTPTGKNTKKVDSLIMTLERTWCYGTCPVYNVEIYKSGKAIYNGKANVENIGQFEGVMTKTEINKLQSIANRIKYYSFNAKYDNNISDIPACNTSVLINGKMTTVHRKGPGPEGLSEFEKAFDNALSNINWTKVK